MTSQRDELDQEIFKILKEARTRIRLKHSLRADDEINSKILPLEEAAMVALVNGKAFEIDLDELVADEA